MDGQENAAQPRASVSLGPEPARRRLRAAGFAGLAALALLLLFGDLGGLDLWAPDEPRYGQVAEELRRMDHGAGDLVLLRLGGEPYTQKPPLYFWLAAAAGALRGGVDEWAARMPSAVAGLATLGVWVAIARRLAPAPAVGWIAGALLLTTFRFVHFARRAQLDVLLALFESLALLGFLQWNALQRNALQRSAAERSDLQPQGDTRRDGARDDGGDSSRRRRALWLLHGSTAAALLTKGPVGLLPWACFVCVLALEGRTRELRSLFPLWGVALAVAPVLGWLAACLALAPAGHFEQAVVENLWVRFAEGTDHARPFWYFVAQLPVEALPWSLLWPVCAVQAWRWRASGRASEPTEHQGVFARRLLLVWIATPLLFFSVSAGKRGVYVLPVLPALCLALAVCIDRVRVRPGPHPWLDGPRAVWLLAALLAAAALTPWPGLLEALASDAPRSRDGLSAAAAAMEAARRGGLALAGAGALASLACLGAGRSSDRWPLDGARGVTVVWLLVAGIWGVVLFGVLPALDPEKSPRPIAEALDRAARPGEPVGLFAQRTRLGGVLFYLAHRERELERAPERDARPAADRGTWRTRRVVALETGDDVRDFIAHGGRVVAVRVDSARALEAIARIRVIERVRAGRRAQWIVELVPGAAPVPRPEAFQ